MQREFYSPEIKGPVLLPTTPLEMDNGNCPVAAPFKDGAFYDPLTVNSNCGIKPVGLEHCLC